MIKSAAIANRVNCRIFIGSSHGDIISNHSELLPDNTRYMTKGFITGTGEFLDREEAAESYELQYIFDIKKS